VLRATQGRPLRVAPGTPPDTDTIEPAGVRVPLHVEHGASFPSVPSLVAGRATRWRSGRNVDRQKRDCDNGDRIECDFRDVETSTPPLLYSLLVHGRPPSVVNAPISAPSACSRTARQLLGEAGNVLDRCGALL
jgi:hypothetical protein